MRDGSSSYRYSSENPPTKTLMMIIPPTNRDSAPSEFILEDVAELFRRNCRRRWIPGSLGIQGCPYVYGFDVAKSSLKWFNEVLKKSIELFINAAYGDRFKVYTRVRAAALRENWNTLKSMPMLTYPPFPLYDCCWHTQAKRFERMEEIPGIDDLRVQIHHRRQERGWSHITAEGHYFTDKFEIPGLMHENDLQISLIPQIRKRIRT